MPNDRKATDRNFLGQYIYQSDSWAAIKTSVVTKYFDECRCNALYKKYNSIQEMYACLDHFIRVL